MLSKNGANIVYEVSPIRGRGILVTMNQLFITFGILIHFTIIYVEMNGAVKNYILSVIPMFTGILGLVCQFLAFPLGMPMELLNR